MSQGKFFEYISRISHQEKRNRLDWANELKVTPRTITNFNQRLEKEYGIAIQYSSGTYGHYYIDKKKSTRYKEFVNFIQNLNGPKAFADSFKDNNEISNHLIFHQDWNKVNWMKYFNQVLTAINDQQYISIKYFNFRTDRNEQLMYFMPYWMKQNAYFRWYIIGFEDDKSAFPTVLGLDKINSLKIDDQKFKRKPSLESYRKEYENVFGVYIYDGREPEIIRIECTKFQAYYLKSLPLHPSQEIESENEQVTVFKYKLVINHEFAYELLRQNAWNFNPKLIDNPHPKRTAIKVLEPTWFVDYFHQTYKRSYLSYSKDLAIIDKIKKDVDAAEYPYPLPRF
jgi:hypothetical protein